MRPRRAAVLGLRKRLHRIISLFCLSRHQLRQCNTVFLQGDVKARAYRTEHFRDGLDRHKLVPEVVALGAYQMNHLWAVTFKDDAGKKKLLSGKAFSVKEHRGVAIDACSQDIRMKQYWLLHATPDEDVRTGLAPFGTVTEISREEEE